jgi:short-subunit dehydrogenase
MFQNKVVWITGASSGIGAQLAVEFALHGAKIALSARRVDSLEAVRAQIELVGAESVVVPCDITDDQAIEDAVEKVVAHFGRLDVAVANAGMGVSGFLEEISATEWRRQFDINVVGLALTARYSLPHLKKTGGRLALVGSVAAYLPNPRTGAYGASKAAVRSIGQTLQVELKNSGVSCTVLHPGFVESQIAKVDNAGVYHADKIDPRPANLMWTTERAARVMVRAIAARKKSYVFTGHGRIGAFLGQHFPLLTAWLIGKAVPSKE